MVSQSTSKYPQTFEMSSMCAEIPGGDASPLASSAFENCFWTLADTCHSNYVPKFISGEEGQRKEKLVWESVVKHIDEVAPGVLKL